MPQILCKDCGKPITGRRCTECNGKGEVRNLIFFKKTCEYCKGLGVVYRCPDEFNHYLKRLSPIKEPMQKRLPELGANLKPRVAKAGINTKYVPKCPMCGLPTGNNQKYCISCQGKMWASSPNNPMNPNSILNPNNPMNPNSLRNPNNPMNPNSLRNPNNPMNPNSILNPNNPMNPNSLRNPNNPMNPANRFRRF